MFTNGKHLFFIHVHQAPKVFLIGNSLSYYQHFTCYICRARDKFKNVSS